MPATPGGAPSRQSPAVLSLIAVFVAPDEVTKQEAFMIITLNLCLKWTLLVTLSAVASFVAALMTGHTTAAHIAGMLAGIVTFIAAYVLIEARARQKGMESFLKALKVGVIVKIGLELIPAIEIFTGMFAVQLLEWLSIHSPFPSAYLKTVITGVILSGFVFGIASIYTYIHNRSLRLATLAAGAMK
jgi:hypothetical protein